MGIRSAARAVPVLACALLVACQSVPEASYQENLRSKEMSPSEGHALVYVVRPIQNYDLLEMAVIVGREPTGPLYGGRYQMAEVPPGLHRVTCSFIGGENVDAIDVQVEAGDVRFLKASRQFGIAAPRVKLEAISDAEGRSFVERFSLGPTRRKVLR